VFQVDGFVGGKIPNRSRIAAIKVIYNIFDAEFHTVGTPMVQITSKPGGEKWNGFVSLTHSNSGFNARNAFEETKLPMKNTSVFASITPPKITKDTSMSFSFSDLRNSSGQNFIGFLPQNVSLKDRDSKLSSRYASINLYQNLTKSQIGFLKYTYSSSKGKGLGLGVFDLAERAYRNSFEIHNMKYSQSGTIGKKSNHFRAEYNKSQSAFKPVHDASAIIIVDALNFGGAGNKSKTVKWKFSASDILSFDYGKHLLKIGGEFSIESIRRKTGTNLNGTFTFSGLNDFKLKKPLIFTQRLVENSERVSQFQTAIFFQDYIRVSKYFQVGAGLRYEWQNSVSDLGNFAPRINFVWSPLKSARFTIQGGIGLVHLWLETDDLLTIRSDNGRNSGELIISNPSFPNPFISDIDRGENALPPAIKQLSGSLRNPRVLFGMMGIKLDLNSNSILRAGYVYARSNSKYRGIDINSPIDGIRPNSNFNRILQIESKGYSKINSFVVSYDTKIKNIPIRSHYFFRRERVDSESIFSLPSDNRNPRIDIGPVSGIPAHNLSISSSFSLFQILKWSAVKNIDIDLETQASSGLPYTITTGRDDNNDSVINDRPFEIGRNTERGEWNSATNIGLTWGISSIQNLFDRNLEKNANITLRLDINNVFNRTNKINYVGVRSSPFFRKPTSAADARNMTVSISYSF